MTLAPTQALVDPDTVLDARLALFHRAERWLAVADLHYGFELSLRAAGALLPAYGMNDIEARLRSLLADYRPTRLILAGDLVHTRAARAEADALFARLRAAHPDCELVPLLGNHDRRAFAGAGLREVHATGRFVFHHGDGPGPDAELVAGRTVILGHHHPAATLSDGAGLQIKLPALVQCPSPARWILPAFSPWAAGGGGTGKYGAGARLWLCSPRRVFELPTR